MVLLMFVLSSFQFPSQPAPFPNCLSFAHKAWAKLVVPAPVPLPFSLPHASSGNAIRPLILHSNIPNLPKAPASSIKPCRKIRPSNLVSCRCSRRWAKPSDFRPPPPLFPSPLVERCLVDFNSPLDRVAAVLLHVRPQLLGRVSFYPEYPCLVRGLACRLAG